MEESWITLNEVPSHIITWGQKVQDSFDENIKEIVLILTGNPGLAGLYTSFCSNLYNELDKQVPVWVISHAGHDEPKKDLHLSIPPLESNHDVYNLQGQVKHKAQLITEFIPKHVKIHLVSHSIGAKISLELMKMEEITDQVKRCYMLFPVIERIAETPNGFWFYKIFNRIFIFLRLFYYAFHFLPLQLRTIILSFVFCMVGGYPEHFLGTIIKASNPKALDKIWFMAEDEMKQVIAIDRDVIEKNLNKLKFYYGASDGWVPSHSYHKLIKEFSNVDAELCSKKIDHGFVISHGPTMARIVSDWIKCHKVL